MGDHDEEIMLKVSYEHCGSQRTTPVFLSSSLVEHLCYDDFEQILRSQLPHVNKLSEVRITYRDEDQNDIDMLQLRFEIQMKDALKTSRSFTIIKTMSPSPDVVLAKKSKTVFSKPEDTAEYRRPKKLDFASTWGPAAADLTNKPLPLESYSAQKQLGAVQERPSRPSPLESYLMQKQKVVESLITRYEEAGKAKKVFELEHSFVIEEKNTQSNAVRLATNEAITDLNVPIKIDLANRQNTAVKSQDTQMDVTN